MKSIPQILSRARLADLLQRFSQLKAGVIGDFALDAYWYMDMTRSVLSRETPHFPRPVVAEAYSPGAGGNVAQNLVALGLQQVSAFSVLGEDAWGSLLKTELERRGVNTLGLLAHPLRRTTAYLKPILMGFDSRQEDARLDFVNVAPLPSPAEAELLAALEGQLQEMDAVLVADQLETNGVLTSRSCQRLIELAQSHPRLPFLADSRTRIGLFASMVLKPNRMEAVAAALPGVHYAQPAWAEIEKAGLALAQRSNRPVFVTAGDQGVLVCTRQGCQHIAAAPVRPPLDIVGAGDAFFAALAAALAAQATPWEAGAVANLAAAVTVEKLSQTGTATPGEILARYDLASNSASTSS